MTRPTLVLDLETVQDPDMPAWKAPREGALPPAPFWKVAVVGMLWLDKSLETKKIDVAPGDERAMMLSLIHIVETRKPTIVTFNGRGFDLPVIAARTLRYGLSFPARWSRDMTHRYDAAHVDLADRLTDHGATHKSSLDAWARLVGMPGKLGDGWDGGSVAQMIANGQLDEVQAYCMCDVVQTAAVHLRFLLGMGMPREHYLKAATSLLAAIDADARLVELAQKVDRERFLLVESTTCRF